MYKGMSIRTSSQKTFALLQLKGAWMENKILPSSSGAYVIDSRGTHLGKRISRPVDLPEFSWPTASRLKENSLPLGTTATEEHTRESTVNQSKCAKTVALGDRFQGDQFFYPNHVGGSMLTSNRESQANEFEKINHYHPLHMQLHSTQQQQHPHSNMPELLNWKSNTSNMLAQADTGRSSSKTGDSYTEKSQSHPYQEDDLLTGRKCVVASRRPLEMHNVSSGFVREVGAVEHNFDTSYAFSHGRGGCPEEANRFGTPPVLEKNHQRLNSSGSNNILSSGTPPTEQKAGGRSLRNELHSLIGSFDNHVDKLIETSGGRTHIEGDIKIKDQEAIDEQQNIKKSFLTDDRSSKDGHRPSNGVQHVESNKSNRSSHRLDEKSRLPTTTKMPLTAEKLWDGSLQLNSSITVSVVASFKSGEKLLDIKWPEFVEVKGKVRLEAFEKYIQDLPRSRNRGLMVISLCFKEGSSEKGLKGMKEVAKGYTKGERVGVAQLCPGVDLYLCPRSDAIITILAKYGFFKGMAAVEGNSELMIGCLVWRKNRTALTCVAKRSDEGKAISLSEQQLQKLPPDSSTLQGGGGQNSLSEPSSVENSKPSTPLNSFSALEQTDVDKNVDIDSSTTSLPPLQQKESGLSSSHFSGSKGYLSSSEAFCVHPSDAAPPMESSTDIPKAVTSLLSNAASKSNLVFSEDDDLPEFDFGAASRISSSSYCSSDGFILDKKLQLSGSRNLDMSKQPTMPVAPSVSMSTPRSVPSSVSQDMPLLGNVTDHGQPKSMAVPMAVSVSASGSLDNLGGKKNIFCDDDDMPEWLPPDAQNEKTTGIFPPESSTSTSRKLPPPPGSVLPFPPSTTTHDGFSFQPSPRLYHPPTNSKVPPPIPSKDGPSYLTGFTFNPVPRRQSGSFAAQSSLQQPADKTVRRS